MSTADSKDKINRKCMVLAVYEGNNELRAHSADGERLPGNHREVMLTGARARKGDSDWQTGKCDDDGIPQGGTLVDVDSTLKGTAFEEAGSG